MQQSGVAAAAAAAGAAPQPHQQFAGGHTAYYSSASQQQQQQHMAALLPPLSSHLLVPRRVATDQHAFYSPSEPAGGNPEARLQALLTSLLPIAAEGALLLSIVCVM